jgi:hypothetical protein
MSDVIASQIQEWRRRSALPAGHPEAMTLDEYREVIAAIRKERVAASEVSTKSRATKATKAAKEAPINSDDLLGELGL